MAMSSRAKTAGATTSVPYDSLPVTHGGDWTSGRRTTARVLHPVMDQRTIVSLFESAERGDAAASEALFAALYTELHRMARREL